MGNPTLPGDLWETQRCHIRVLPLPIQVSLFHIPFGLRTGATVALGFPQVLWQGVSHKSIGSIRFPTGPWVALGLPQVKGFPPISWER